jgi:hypothetical protein
MNPHALCGDKDAQRLRQGERPFVFSGIPDGAGSTSPGVEVSQLLPYGGLVIPFAYFFHQNNGKKPNATQGRFLTDFLWRCSLGGRYSSSFDSRVTVDLGLIAARQRRRAVQLVALCRGCSYGFRRVLCPNS